MDKNLAIILLLILKNLGITILLIGAVLLIVEGLTHRADNTLLIVGLPLVLVGYIAHIFLNRKVQALLRDFGI